MRRRKCFVSQPLLRCLRPGALTRAAASVRPRVRIASFSQHHVDDLDMTATPLSHMQHSFPSAVGQVSAPAAHPSSPASLLSRPRAAVAQEIRPITQELRNHLGSFGISGTVCAASLHHHYFHSPLLKQPAYPASSLTMLLTFVISPSRAQLATQTVFTLSGGQKSRVALAKITWSQPHILLLDEVRWCSRHGMRCQALSESQPPRNMR